VLCGLLAAAVLGVAFLLYLAPAGHAHRFGLAVEGADPFRAVFASLHGLAPLSPVAFVWLFRALITAAWVAWATLLVQEAARPSLSRRSILTITATLACILAVTMPPVLSNDVFAYVAYARLGHRYGLNPYVFDRPALESVGDPAGAYLIWGTPLAYGPLWTAVALALEAMADRHGLWAELFVHKAAAAASLVAIVVAGGRIAERREFGNARLTMLALGLNPLLLVEGPGTGHNDLLMMALVLVGAAVAMGRPRAGAVIVGLGAAIKATALAFVPLLALTQLRPSVRRAWPRVSIIVLLAIAPTFLLSFAFGGPMVLLESLGTQLTEGHQPLRLTAARWLLGPAFLWGCYLTWTADLDDAAAWLTGIIPVAFVLAVLMSPVAFPWYLTWAIVPAVTAWNERHRLFTTAAGVLGFLFMWMYVVTP
jgi:hypothetical protein